MCSRDYPNKNKRKSAYEDGTGNTNDRQTYAAHYGLLVGLCSKMMDVVLDSFSDYTGQRFFIFS